MKLATGVLPSRTKHEKFYDAKESLTQYYNTYNATCQREAAPADEACVEHSEGKACAAHSHILKKAEVHDLMLTSLVIELNRGLLLVRLDAAHIIRLLVRK